MIAALAPFVEAIWTSSSDGAPGVERVLPTGAMHLVVRLEGPPLVVFGERGASRLGHVIVGGPRSRFYVKSRAGASRAVGATLRPGASMALFGVPASELAERHTRLDDLWKLGDVRDELATASDPAAAFARILCARLRVTRDQPAVAAMLAVLESGASVAAAVERAGYSHRACVALFRAAVGLTPKAYARVRRFQRALVARGPLAEVALAHGYADQAHLCRDFAELAGIAPAAHRKLGLVSPNHVPWSDFSKTALAPERRIGA